MARRLVCAAALACFAFLSICPVSFAQEDTEGLKKDLKSLRVKKADMLVDYNIGIHNIKKESEERMDKIKKEYSSVREECLADEHNKTTNLRKDYEKSLKEAMKEEERLIRLIGPDAREDFAKARR